MISSGEILALIGQRVRLVEQGSHTGDNTAGYCPFHKEGQEQSPSFYIYTGEPKRHRGRMVWPGDSFCHTCQQGWSITTLLKKLGITARTIDFIREEIEKETRTAIKRPFLADISFDLITLPETLLGLYQYVPKLMLQEGFNRDLLIEHEIGFDRTNKRIIFPIRNHRGELVGLSGRTVQEDYPRYKIYRKELAHVVSNYSFEKTRVLWGLHSFYMTRMHYHSDEPVIVCEGFKAALWLRQCGFPHTVAMLGTYLSMEQRVLLARVANSVVLFLDNDPAGKEGTKKIVTHYKDVSVLTADYGTDDPISPDDLTEKQVQKAVAEAYTRTGRRK